jgi:mannose/cellobiose epimerase-like protein (N-acyl-D-glucosamine 2-epimerase family)
MLVVEHAWRPTTSADADIAWNFLPRTVDAWEGNSKKLVVSGAQTQSNRSMTARSATRAILDRIRHWTYEQALPFWAGAGRDPVGGGFVERMHLDGAPDLEAPKRIRVQARQTYVFSHAAVLGWPGGLEAAEAGMRLLLAHGRRADGLWGRVVERHGALIDDRADLYDNAFVLLALAWFHRASGDPECAALAHRTFDALQTVLGRADGRGLRAVEGEVRGLQNPHMHLLEALLALYACTGEGRWAEEACKVGRLFDEALFDPATGTLAELFDERWRRTEPAALEPGHHFEWIWLLRRLDQAIGTRHDAEADALFAFALRLGTDPASGLVWAEVDAQGRVLNPTHRLWAMTELMKALIARAEGGANDAGALDKAADVLFDRYLDPAPEGGWRDLYDAEGRLLDRFMPASSLYHLFLAFAEAMAGNI